MVFHIAINQKLFELLKGSFDGLLITFITISVAIVVLVSNIGRGAEITLGGLWWNGKEEENKLDCDGMTVTG